MVGLSLVFWFFVKIEELALVVLVGVDLEDMRYWNPLENDGDALRLAVKCKIKPDSCHGYTSAMWYAPYNKEMREKHNGNPYAATRRAIVRAAAEIGKEMK